jgi:hypothetical protein
MWICALVYNDCDLKRIWIRWCMQNWFLSHFYKRSFSLLCAVRTRLALRSIQNVLIWTFIFYLLGPACYMIGWILSWFIMHSVQIVSEGSLHLHLCIGQSSETVFKEKHGVWNPMPGLTITHIISHSQLCCQLSPSLQRERRGVVGKIFFWLSNEHVCICVQI